MHVTSQGYLCTKVLRNSWRNLFFELSKIERTVCYKLPFWIWKMMNENVFIKISLSGFFNLIENLFWLNRWLEVNAATYTDSVFTTNYVFLSAEVMLAKKSFLGNLKAKSDRLLDFCRACSQRKFFGLQFWFSGLWFFYKTWKS